LEALQPFEVLALTQAMQRWKCHRLHVTMARPIATLGVLLQMLVLVAAAVVVVDGAVRSKPTMLQSSSLRYREVPLSVEA
jgi:hypothetical protein